MWKTQSWGGLGMSCQVGVGWVQNYRMSRRNRKQIENYSLEMELGSGVYSHVYKAVNIITNQEVAIKMVKADKFKEMPKLEEGTINEINTLTALKPCPNIIRYFDMLKTVNNFYFVYQFCNGGTLERELKRVGSLGEKQSLLYFRQLINGFKVLAENHIMHRDIKPENILIHNGVLKIADFGFCKPLEHQDGMAETMLGSPIYMAPEVLKGEPYTMKADVWSLGVVLYRMMYGFCPFQSNNIGKLIMILNQNQLRIPESHKTSPVLEELIRRMLTKDPKKRADWNEVFTFQISESGEITDLKMKYDPSSASLKASTATSLSIYSSRPAFMKQKSDEQVRGVKKVESPHHFDSTAGYRGDKNFNQTTTNDPSLRETFRSKSPLRGIVSNRYSKKQVHIKNHKKCKEITSMVMDVAQYSSADATAVAYFLSKSVEKEFLILRESIRKESLPTNQNSSHTRYSDEGFILQLGTMVNEQLQSLSRVLSSFEGILYDFGISPQEPMEEKRSFLRRFILSLPSLDNKEELSLCHQLLDFILEDILINKKTYEKISAEQMQKKIKDRLQEMR